MRIPALRVELRIPLLYAIFGGAWILFSDLLLAAMVSEPAALTRMQTYKGWAFVAVSALLISLLLRRELALRNITEGKLGETEERYKMISSVASDYMFYTRVDAGGQHHLDWVAGAFEGITGYTFEEYAARGGWRASLHPDDLETDDRDLGKLRSGKRVISEVRTVTKSGGTRWVRVYAQPVLDPKSRELTGIYGAVQEITEQKKAEQALYESESRLKAILNKAPVVLHAMDRSGTITFSEGAGFSDTGLRPGDLVGQSAADLYGNLPISLPDGELISGGELLERTLAGEAITASVELNGVHLENRFAPLPDQEGRVNGVVGISIDITERREAEQKLVESEGRYRALFENMTAGFVLFEVVQDGQGLPADLVLLAGNRVFEATTGLNMQEAANKRLTQVLPGIQTDTADWIGTYGKIALTGEARELEQFSVVLGRHFSINAYRAAPGQCAVTFFDMTSRKQTEEALQKSEELYRKLTENYPNGTVNIYDRELRMTFVGGGDLKKYDLKPEDFLGRTFQELAPPETFAIAEPHLLAAFEGESRQYETPYWNDWHYLVNVAPLKEADGSIREILVVTQNLTERKRAEEELRLSRDRLTELSRRLAQARETEARAIGRELHDQIGQMLTAMKVTLDLAVQLPAEVAAGKIVQAQELAGDLLGRISRLSLELRPPMLDDLGLIPALVWQVSRYQEGSGIQVDFKHSGVEGRRFATEIETTAYRIVQEALTNVARHSAAGRVRLEVRIEAGVVPNGFEAQGVRSGSEWMNIRIEDDGTGFDVDSAMAKNRGLSGMRERAQLVGGIFEIVSEIGAGTKKRIWLPLHEQAA